jgi:hypothetical protein
MQVACMHAGDVIALGSRRSLLVTRVESDIIFAIGMTLIIYLSSPTQLHRASKLLLGMD